MYERYRGERVSAGLLCRQEVLGHPMPRVSVPRGAIIPVLAACLLLATVLVLFFQVRSFLGHIETRMAADTGGDPRLRAIDREMVVLRGKFHGVLAESVEMRLKALEKNVDAGKLGPEDFRAFEELQRDLRLLESYAESSPVAALDYGQREHGRFRPLPQDKGVTGNGEVMRELVELKTLFYFCLAGLGTSTVAMVGYYWLLRRRDSRRIDTIVGRLPMLTRPSSNNGG